MNPLRRLAISLRHLRLSAGLTQEQMAEVAGFEFKFYQKIENGRKPQVKLETVERLGRPFGLEVWQILAPIEALRRMKTKRPRPKSPAKRGPRALP
ncbi:MAG: helix-turn-helix domain-containing protein [Verrucomicrobia bacterium]|nr:helix-turn-helix domain-containing protein [Verrucomicrobiota bacterium]